MKEGEWRERKRKKREKRMREVRADGRKMVKPKHEREGRAHISRDRLRNS